jgi:hypothetical protein
VTEWELEIFTHIRIEAHNVIILNRLLLADLIMENHGLGSTPVERVASVKQAALKYGML